MRSRRSEPTWLRSCPASNPSPLEILPTSCRGREAPPSSAILLTRLGELAQMVGGRGLGVRIPYWSVAALVAFGTTIPSFAAAGPEGKWVIQARAVPDEKVPAGRDPGRSYRGAREWPSNAEMAEIFRADQAARADPAKIDWSKVAAEDAVRRVRTKALLDAGALQSGDDFWQAAFVFQHGGEPADYLLAHTLAILAAARGRPDATWIAAATLDRYLQSIGQKQIYGTQFRSRPGQPTTQEPYDRTLVSDALRSALAVPTLAEQEKRRAEIEARYKAAP